MTQGEECKFTTTFAHLEGEECEFTTTFAHLGLSTTVMEGRLDMDHDLLTTFSSHQLQAEAAISFLQLTAK